MLRYAHSMLAYVEPWVHRGIGCSGVPNFDHIEEMKDRATERIDGAIIANWLLHGVVSRRDIEESLKKAAEVVDEQNASQPDYAPMMDTAEKRDNVLTNPAVTAVLQIVDEALTSAQRLRGASSIQEPEDGKGNLTVRRYIWSLTTKSQW